MDLEIKEGFERRGWWVARGLLDAATLAFVARCCREALQAVDAAHRARFRSQGSVVDITDFPAFAGVIGRPEVLGVLDRLGLGGAAFSSGSVISKPPGSGPLFWHQDWWAWDDPLSLRPAAPQVNAMIYLTPTARANGCLRVIPGSHRSRHALHDCHGDPAALSAGTDPEHALYRSCDDEAAVEVQTGDVVFKDARLLHGAYANGSGAERTMLSLNFNPGYAGLPPAMQATICAFLSREHRQVPLGGLQEGVARWPREQRDLIRHLLPVRPAGAAPRPLEFAVRLP